MHFGTLGCLSRSLYVGEKDKIEESHESRLVFKKKGDSCKFQHASEAKKKRITHSTRAGISFANFVVIHASGLPPG